MSKLVKLFSEKSKQYKHIYNESSSNKLLHQEKRVRLAIVEQIIKDRLISSNENSIIDIGCGTGNLLMNLKKRDVKAKMFGIDISPKMIDLANDNLKNSNHKDLVFAKGAIEDLSIKADVVVSLGVSGYQKNQEKFLQQLTNHVEKYGILVFTTGNGDSLTRLIRLYLSRLHSKAKGIIKRDGVKFQTIKESKVSSIMSENGFELEEKKYITFGLGLGSSYLECFLDRFFLRNFSKNFLSKYFSLTVIYLFRKAK